MRFLALDPASLPLPSSRSDGVDVLSLPEVNVFFKMDAAAPVCRLRATLADRATLCSGLHIDL